MEREFICQAEYFCSDRHNCSDMREEIIRCRDCKEHEPSGICSYWSTYDADVSTSDDGFCAWAERMD